VARPGARAAYVPLSPPLFPTKVRVRVRVRRKYYSATIREGTKIELAVRQLTGRTLIPLLIVGGRESPPTVRRGVRVEPQPPRHPTRVVEKFAVGIEKVNHDAVDTSSKNLKVSRIGSTRSTSDTM